MSIPPDARDSPVSPGGAGAGSPRGELAALAARGLDWALPSDRRLVHPEMARHSAVLALFGPHDAPTSVASAASSAAVDSDASRSTAEPATPIASVASDAPATPTRSAQPAAPATTPPASSATPAASETPAASRRSAPAPDPTPARTLDDVDVVLVRRASTLRHHAGQFAFPGGGREEHDASPAATAMREAVEETGIDPAGVDILGELPPLPIPVSRNLVTPVLAWWRDPCVLYAADPRETAEVFRMPVARLVDPTCRVSVHRVRGHGVLPMPAFQVGDRLIWGFTAIVLSGILDALGWARPWDHGRRITVDA